MSESILISDNIKKIYEERCLGLTSVRNARELGGYKTRDGRKVKQRMLIRSGHLASLSDEDAKVLKDDYNLKHVFDLRTLYEESSKPDKKLDGVTYTRLDIMDDIPIEELASKASAQKITGDENIDLAVAYYFSKKDDYNSKDELYFSEHALEGYKKIFTSLIEYNGATLFHCTAGKDRTGFVASIILTALSVDKETVFDDYEATNASCENIMMYTVEKLDGKGYSDEDIINIAKTSGVERKNIKDTFHTLEERYGSVENYIREAIGISDEQI
ncbi:MAG: tyrosine-protein phosphatase, partial [Lachnospiraceae bacterium]|nr:tyrosine-protein phosphatase [Lachnospiraceae bacterium]